MTTVVGIMDRSSWRARTDNIVICDPTEKRLLWVPRDLWCGQLQNRINVAFARGGHHGLVDALAQHDLLVHHSLCILRDAVERALAPVEVTVPVERELVYWYPLQREKPIEEGKKLVRFDPPAELLTGERLHQWIGARYSPEGSSTDFDRIERQQVLLKCLMTQGFDFGRVIHNPAWLSVSSPEAFTELGQVDRTWRFETYAEVEPATIKGMRVLLVCPQGPLAFVRRRWRRRFH
jgi:anionic cell wall polymer biosynthesis LytR-Cps2A-Psr (LCP) family protein